MAKVHDNQGWKIFEVSARPTCRAFRIYRDGKFFAVININRIGNTWVGQQAATAGRLWLDLWRKWVKEYDEKTQRRNGA